MLRAETAAGGRKRYGGYPEGEAPSTKFQSDEDGDVLAFGRMDSAVLLTYDSELDKDDKFRQLALVRRLDSVIDPTQRSALRLELQEHARLRFFYLPGQKEDPPFDERYVDLRRITTLRGSALRPEDRLASMTDELREGLRTQFVKFYSRGKLA